eukprot:jgi/Hompol1/4628/HPOL_003781-RA
MLARAAQTRSSVYRAVMVAAAAGSLLHNARSFATSSQAIAASQAATSSAKRRTPTKNSELSLKAAVAPQLPNAAAAAAAAAAGLLTKKPFSQTTKDALLLMHNQTQYYAVVEIKNRPYHVSKNDVIVTPRMKDLQLGDIIELDRVREIGSSDFVLQGNPYIDPRFFKMAAVVVEHAVSKDIHRVYWKRSGNVRRTTRNTAHTLLRVCEMDIVKPE